MDRSIVGFHTDSEGDWVAELDCGHRQHLRHRPPFQVRPWVLDEAQRAEHLGTPLDCPLCDRGEMPEGLRFARRSAQWDARSLPAGVRRAHRLGSGTWGRLVVREGSVGFRARTTPPIDCVLEAGAAQAIPPGVEHEIEPADDARFFIEFLGAVRREIPLPSGQVEGGAQPCEPDLGGDPACWADLFCPECGSELRLGHLGGCPSA